LGSSSWHTSDGLSAMIAPSKGIWCPNQRIVIGNGVGRISPLTH
jgi:hypothetical protein